METAVMNRNNQISRAHDDLNLWCRALQVSPATLLAMSDRDIEDRVEYIRRQAGAAYRMGVIPAPGNYYRQRGGAQVFEIYEDDDEQQEPDSPSSFRDDANATYDVDDPAFDWTEDSGIDDATYNVSEPVNKSIPEIDANATFTIRSNASNRTPTNFESFERGVSAQRASSFNATPASFGSFQRGVARASSPRRAICPAPGGNESYGSFARGAAARPTGSPRVPAARNQSASSYGSFASGVGANSTPKSYARSGSPRRRRVLPYCPCPGAK
ncbi:uncharacterized protein LOC119647594 [Hermetia illucens]|uniref:uncharacterized protein LOC119647594 n=1 Tax=Hermetia illucens TaxID=343691 RepID=UPI0018CC484F|nr:uncharacterized protein LOC119647594 [Hermetia illucens]